MAITIEQINNAGNDAVLVDLLTEELERRFPLELQGKPEEFLAALRTAPPGLRAMAATHALDFSVNLDDLVWHFGKHNHEALLHETVLGLKELGAREAAEVFSAACDLMRPYLAELRGSRTWGVEEFLSFLRRTGIQDKMSPLNNRMWDICQNNGELALLQFWATYARQHPEKCV